MEDADAYDRSIPYLYCVNCSHDLNHPLYLIQSHPIVSSLPVCILCYEELNSKLYDVLPTNWTTSKDSGTDSDDDMNTNLNRRSEICNICSDGGDLYVCSDEHHCNRAYCHDCINDLFGLQELQRVDQLPYWKCYSCDSDQGTVCHFKSALTFGERQSMYNREIDAPTTIDRCEIKRVSVDDATADDEGLVNESRMIIIGEDDSETKKELSILKAIIESCDEALVNIDRDAVQEKEREVREELFLRQLTVDPASR